MLNESCINCFLTLAQTLNFTKAANIMSFSQQAVSQMISRMENDIGVHLFVRSNHHVAITPAGRERFHSLHSRLHQAEQQALSRFTVEDLSRFADFSEGLLEAYAGALQGPEEA